MPIAIEERRFMPAQAATATNGRQEAARLYRELEDRMLARDQEGGSRVYYELLRRGRPLPEIMAEAVRIHAPYTHVPYHQTTAFRISSTTTIACFRRAP